MTDKPAALTITDPHHIPAIFVNQLAGSGQLNGVVNLTFATANFMPKADGSVDPDLVVTSRLRMDFYCAVQLRDALNALIEQNTAAKKAN